MKHERVAHEFVEYIPEQLTEGVVYVSIPFRTVVHRCFCGCGLEVVTPLSPTKWTLSFDGQAVSLTPSIGNWSFPCQSHYWIRGNRVEWTRRWTLRQIAAARALDGRDSAPQEVDSAPQAAAVSGRARRSRRGPTPS